MAAMDREVGYDCDFYDLPPKAVQCDCPVCMLVLRDPHQVSCCGYSYCRSCVERVNTCPTCNARHFDVFRDKRLKRSLNDFRVFCVHKSEGCEWVDELGQLDNHLNLTPLPEELLSGCQFSQVSCTFCSSMFQRRHINDHKSNKCPLRPYTCPHCNDYSGVYEVVTGSHLELCDSYPIPCSSDGCEDRVPRLKLSQHLLEECTLAIVDCDFRSVGCDVRVKRKDLDAHLHDSVVKHQQLQQKVILEMQATIERLKIENAALRVSLGKCESGGLNSPPPSLQILPILITMSGFAGYKMSGEVWISSPFYTSSKGYKMCMRVLPNGLKGGHVAVNLRLMRGNFDNDLEWPYLGNITIQLLNWIEDRHHVTDSLPFTNPKTNCQVKVGEMAELGPCAPDFVSHAQLGIDPLKYTQFLKEDQLRFRVSLATDPIRKMEQVGRQCEKLVQLFHSIEPKVAIIPIEVMLTDFEKLRQLDQTWTSPAFYTHQGGYRMCLQVSFQRKTLSVYVCMMRGQFDSSLEWPFRGEIFVELVNQIGDFNHHQRCISICDDDDFGEQVLEGECSLGLGLPRFIPLGWLGYYHKKRTKFLVNDSLCIRITRINCDFLPY